MSAPDDDEDRKAILQRRAIFVASALASLALTEEGCRPQPCLESVVVADPPPQPCLSQRPNPPPAGPDAGEVLDPQTPPPQPCLSIAVPQTPAPPDPIPQPCLEIAAPPADAGSPEPCLRIAIRPDASVPPPPPPPPMRPPPPMPHPCLRVASQPCLSVRPPMPAPPRPCLDMPAPKTGDDDEE